MRSPSRSRPGSERARAPVATMMCSARIWRVSPSAVISIRPAPPSRAVPAMWVTLFFLNRKATPLEILVATPRERAIIAGKS